MCDSPGSDVTKVNSVPSTPYKPSDAANKLRELRLSPSSYINSPLQLEKPASALLPPLKLERSASPVGTIGMAPSRPASRNTGPFADMTLVKVDQEVMTWSEK